MRIKDYSAAAITQHNTFISIEIIISHGNSRYSVQFIPSHVTCNKRFAESTTFKILPATHNEWSGGLLLSSFFAFLYFLHPSLMNTPHLQTARVGRECKGDYVYKVRNPASLKKFALSTMLSILRTRATLPVFSSATRFLPILPTYSRALSSSTLRAFTSSGTSWQYGEGRRGGYNERYDSSPREFRQTARTPRNAPSTTLWVGNLPFNATPGQVEELFAEFGTVVSVRLGKLVFICVSLQFMATHLSRHVPKW